MIERSGGNEKYGGDLWTFGLADFGNLNCCRNPKIDHGPALALIKPQRPVTVWDLPPTTIDLLPSDKSSATYGGE
jgi:hypothetical protein